jgi:hypothetical protein
MVKEAKQALKNNDFNKLSTYFYQPFIDAPLQTYNFQPDFSIKKSDNLLEKLRFMFGPKTMKNDFINATVKSYQELKDEYAFEGSGDLNYPWEFQISDCEYNVERSFVGFDVSIRNGRYYIIGISYTP